MGALHLKIYQPLLPPHIWLKMKKVSLSYLTEYSVSLGCFLSVFTVHISLKLIWLYLCIKLWLSHVMGRHYVFMLIFELFNLSEKFTYLYELPLRICVCLSPDKMNFNSKSYLPILKILHILIKQDVEKTVMKKKL